MTAHTLANELRTMLDQYLDALAAAGKPPPQRGQGQEAAVHRLAEDRGRRALSRRQAAARG